MRRAFVILALVADALISAARADPDCTCRSQGRDYRLGASVCLQSPRGPRIATCGMVLNNTSWQFSDTPCVISAAPGRAPQDEHAAALRRSAAAKPHSTALCVRPLDPWRSARHRHGGRPS